MILDTSAIVALYVREPGFERFREAVEKAEIVLVGAPTVLETAMVLSRHLGQDVRAELLSFLRGIDVEIVPFTEKHASAAITAFLRFGRGRHPAGLNFGDCMLYAIASEAGLPLLFKGDDFAQTDIARA